MRILRKKKPSEFLILFDWVVNFCPETLSRIFILHPLSNVHSDNECSLPHPRDDMLIYILGNG